MSRQMSVFVSSAVPLERLCAALEKFLGATARTTRTDFGPVFKWYVTGQEFTLISDHGLVADGDLDFSHYEYQIDVGSLLVGVREETLSHFRTYVSLVLAEFLATEHRCNTLVVENLQKEVWRSDS